VSWNFDDGNGNAISVDQNVIINDVTAPVPDAPTLADVIASCEVTSLTPPTATDNCGGTVTVSNNASLPISGAGTVVVTWSFEDENGNASTQNQNVVIQLESPVISSAVSGTSVICNTEEAGVLSIPPVEFATNYNWQLPAGASIISGANTNNISINFSNVPGDQAVMVLVVSNACGSDAAPAFVVNFECASGCANPFPAVEASSTMTTVFTNGAALEWDAVPSQIGCQIQARLAGGPGTLGSAIVPGVNADSFIIPFSALQPSTDYEWRVRCGCSQTPLVAGPWSAWQPFSTPSGAALTSSPNPTAGQSNVTFTVAEEEYTTLEVYDMSGRIVDAIFAGVAQPNNDYRFQFDGSALPNGVYLYRLTTTSEVVIEKFMIAR
jgi:hypothetical protein